MNILQKIVILLVCLTLVSVKIQAQDVSINIINQPSTVTQGSALGRVTVDICNNDGGSRSAPANRLRPLITLPSNLVGSVIPITTTGWTVLPPDVNNPTTIRFENTVAIAPGECSQIVIGYTGVNIGGPLTVTGTLGFNGPQTTGNLPGNDNSTTSITVITGDTDGDGDPDITDPQPTDPCSWGTGQVLANTTTAWRTADCDGDGVTNYKEATGTDNDPLTLGDNTNPNDGCSYNKVDQVIGNVSALWLAGDCDKDGNPNGTDLNPQVATAVNDVLTAPFGLISTVSVLSNDDFLPVASTVITRTGGDASGVVVFAPTTGVMSYTPSATEPGTSVTVVYQVCNTATTPNVCATATVTISVPLAGDQDGDGDPDNTDPQPTNPCVWSSSQVLSSTTPAWRTADCDGDGVTNYDEAVGTDGNPATLADNTDPLSACSLNLGQVTLVATSTGDCDGDGVTNKDEINGIDDNPLTLGDNTNPNDGCSYNKIDQVIGNVSASWKTLDCDKDGNPNETDLNPQVATAVNDVLTAPFGLTSTVSVLSNDDFLPVASTVITRTGGDASGVVVFAPTTGVMSYTPSATEPGTSVTVVYQVCNTATTPNVCATATVTISVPLAGDQDGDGDPDNTDPQPTNPCVWSSSQVLSSTTTAWRTADCDGDGVTNYDEAIGTDGNPATLADNTDPLSACSLNLGQVTLVATSTGDCDGDGVTNKDEINGIDDNPLTLADNTNPNDGCSYNKVDQVIGNVSALWLAGDCDKDGNPNGTDLNPQVATAVNDVLTAPFGLTSTVSVLSNDDFLPVASTVITRTGGDASGVVVFAPTTGVMSYTPSATEPGTSVTVVYQVCNTATTPNVCATATVTISVPLAGDQDGDGDPDNTDPQPTNPCVWSSSQVLSSTTTAWRTADCDGDGVTNYDEAIGTDGNPATLADNTDPLSACSLNLGQVTLVATSTGDCDGDGVTNKDEINGIDDNPLTLGDNTNPNDGCSYNKVDQVIGNVSALWLAGDCDKDGNPNGTDLNPQVATAVNDVLTAPFGLTSTVSVLSNDDFLPVASTVITRTGGDASGVVVFAPTTGVMSYTPSATEPGTSVTVVYQVCNTATTPNVCATATVTISVPLAGDQDGDGDPDNTDPQPTNPCVWSSSQVLSSTTTAWRTADCDGDGVTNYDEAIGTDGNPATLADNTDPLSACSLNLGQVTLVATSTGDCDGDGVTNKDEINGIDDNPLTLADNTNPNDGCSYNKVDQVIGNVSALWLAGDCDKDGNPNGTDLNPQVATAVNDVLTAPFGLTSTVSVLSNDDFLPVASTVITRTGGDASGVVVFAPTTGVMSYTPSATEPGTSVTVVYQVCNTATTPNVCATATVTISVPLAGDQDGDGDPDNTDPQPTNPCVWSSSQVLSSTTTAWRTADCDGDGVTNYDEAIGTDGNPATLADNTDPLSACSLNLGQVTLVATSTGDCDGDGVTNKDEINGIDDNPLTTADNTNPNDGCSYNKVDQVIGNVSALWLAGDCDKDGNPNGTDLNPQVATAVNDVLTAPFGLTSTVSVLSNDDFLPVASTVITRTGGDASGLVVFAPTTGVMSYTPSATEPGTSVTVVYQVCNTATTPNVCATATVTISVPLAGDQDGDGDPDNTDPQPTNPCVWSSSQVLSSTTPAWRTADCDGDGVTNYDEAAGTDGTPATLADNTDPLSACSLNLGQVTLVATSTGDCDGDGVTNKDEINGIDDNPLTTADNTNPNDGCSYNKVDQVIGNVSALWLAGDCDKDGNPNGTDLNPQVATAVNDVLTAPFGLTSTVSVLSNDDFLPVASTVITRTGGDASGVVVFAPTTGVMSYTPSATEPGTSVTVVYQVCNTATTPNVCATATVTISVPLAGDQDGDGDPDNTDPQPTNPCVWSSSQVLSSTTTAWRTADCDGDGVTNYDEAIGTDGNPATLADNTDPLSACSLNLGQVTLVATSTGDCDGDGVTNKDEINGIDDNPLTLGDNTNPNDGCSYNKVDQVIGNVSALWLAGDCDKDGNPNGTDLNPQVATAVNDVLTAPFGLTSTVSVLSNDDFLPVASTVITRTGGDASGVVVFAPTTGVMSYTPSATEPGTSVTVVYQVCNTATTPNVCATATVTISVPLAGDQDGDGDPDNTDPQPTNPCVWSSSQVLSSTTTAWRTADCDGDGVTNYDEAIGTDGNPATLADNTDPLSACSLNLGQVTLVATSTGDCDGDGVTNKDEINGIDDNPLTLADNTNPNDGCSYNKVDQVIGNVSALWLAGDCDKDGNPNGTDLNPQVATAVNDVLTAPFGLTSTVSVLSNDDFLPVASTVITRTGGDASGLVVFAPTTGVMSYTPSATEPGTSVTVVYQVCNTATTPNVCATATVTISVPLAGDQDGDGDPDNTDPQPTNPCVWSSSQVLSSTTTAWRTADCDGDGVTNYDEAIGTDGNPATLADNTDPLSACSLNLGQVTLVATSTGDCDGDGVTNKDEINGIDDNPLTTADNTNPNDGCSYNKVDQVIGNVSALWLAGDCDKDGNPNGTDLNPQVATAVNDVLTAPFGLTSTVSVLSNDDFLPVASTVITRTGGDASGVVVFAPTTGVMSYTPSATEPGTSVTVVYQVCNTATTPNVCATATVTISVPLAGDQDGDGDPDNTDPQPTNPCVWSSSQVLSSTTPAWRTADCDGDGVTNYDEAIGTDGNPATLADNTDPLSACSLNLGQVTLVATSTGDCDGDGVTNKDEINGIDDNPLTLADNTNPNDGCSYNKVDQVIGNVSALWLAGDCDKDGNPNGTDLNPQVATAVNDVLTAPFGLTSTVSVLSNDDFLPVLSTVVTRTGGTATGTVVFAPTTGVLSYTPTVSEPGTTVTVVYQVCNTLVTPQVCANATVTITVPAAPRLSIAKAAPSGSINAFDNFTYTITVSNLGSAATTGTITVKDTLQSGLSFVSSSTATGWSCSSSGQVVTCTRTSSIPSGSNSSFSLTVTALSNGIYQNKAGVYGGGDPVAIDGTTAAQSNSTSVSVGQSVVKLTAKVFLRGAYDTNVGLMLDGLRSQGLIPLVQPYGKGSYTDIPHIGAEEATTTSVLSVTGNNAIVDWVSVELRDKNNPSTILYSRSGLVQRDGDIVDVDGVSCLSFVGAVPESYYVTIRHRNHLGAMTANAIALTSSCSALVDFTSSSLSLYKKATTDPEYTAYPTVELGSVRALWGGNASPDRFVIYQGPNNDRTFIGSVVLTDAGNTEGLNNYMVTGYLRPDINLDGLVIFQGPGNDVNLLFNEIFTHPENVEKLNNFIIYQQLP